MRPHGRRAIVAPQDPVKKFCVYVVTNLVNGKQYIGATTKGLKRRRRGHFALARQGGGRHFGAAIRKYGAENFSWKILFKASNEEEMYKKEIELIKKYRPVYNVSRGGKGPIHTVEMLPKIGAKPVTCLETGEVFLSASIAGKYYGKGHVGQTCNGITRHYAKKHFIWGDKKLSKKERNNLIFEIELKFAKQRRRVTRRKQEGHTISGGRDISGRRATGPMNSATPIICVETGEIYPSIAEASRQFGIHNGVFYGYFQNHPRYPTVLGRNFKYAEFP